MSRGLRWAMAIVGLLLLMFGLATTIGFLKASVAFDADRECTRSVTLVTSPRLGRTCSIVAGTVSLKYRNRSNRTTDDHIVVLTNGGASLDVVVENGFWSGAYRSTGRGDAAVVETWNGRPALIATPAGTFSGSADPRAPLAIVWIFIPVGALLIFVAARRRPIGGRGLPVRYGRQP